MFQREPSDADLQAIDLTWDDLDLASIDDDDFDDDDFDVDAYAEWYQEQQDFPEDWR